MLLGFPRRLLFDLQAQHLELRRLLGLLGGRPTDVQEQSTPFAIQHEEIRGVRLPGRHVMPDVPVIRQPLQGSKDAGDLGPHAAGRFLGKRARHL